MVTVIIRKQQEQIYGLVAAIVILIFVLNSSLCSSAHDVDDDSSLRSSHSLSSSSHCDHHHHHHHHDEGGVLLLGKEKRKKLLPEEMAEEEDLKLMLLSPPPPHHHHQLSPSALWIRAMCCSLLVSLASLVCLFLLPLIFVNGKPSKTVVDSLAVFGAGAMLGDAFLHQLPHAFGGEHSHSHDHHADHVHSGNEHSHSLEDLSVGLSVLAGIVLFLFVEKVVRFVDDMSGEANVHSHHHHHHKSSKKLKNENDAHDDNHQNLSVDEKDGSISKVSSEEEVLDKVIDEFPNGKMPSKPASLRKRNKGTNAEKPKAEAISDSTDNVELMDEKEPTQSSSNLVFGYLNLFSDGVHNFTDGMALGSAFLLFGSVGGWSRTLFLLAHELPQEIGDFGILVRSGFSVSSALFFNFLSALVALAGTALALLWGQDPGQSSLIEGFTAGGFIYIAVAGVLAETNNGSSSLRSTAIQLTSLILGMTVALCISLVE